MRSRQGFSATLPPAGVSQSYTDSVGVGMGGWGLEAGLTVTHLWLKGGSRRQSRRRDKLRNFDWLCDGGLQLRQNHSRLWICAAITLT